MFWLMHRATIRQKVTKRELLCKIPYLFYNEHNRYTIDKVFYIATLSSNVLPDDGSMHEPEHVTQ
jgi:hypothetical protein